MHTVGRRCCSGVHTVHFGTGVEPEAGDARHHILDCSHDLVGNQVVRKPPAGSYSTTSASTCTRTRSGTATRGHCCTRWCPRTSTEVEELVASRFASEILSIASSVFIDRLVMSRVIDTKGDKEDKDFVKCFTQFFQGYQELLLSLA